MLKLCVVVSLLLSSQMALSSASDSMEEFHDDIILDRREAQVSLPLSLREYENVFSVSLTASDGTKLSANRAALIQTQVFDEEEESTGYAAKALYFNDSKTGRLLIRFPRVRVVFREGLYRIEGTTDLAPSSGLVYLTLDPQTGVLEGKVKVLSKDKSFVVRGNRLFCPTQLKDRLPLAPNAQELTLSDITGEFRGGLKGKKQFVGDFLVEGFELDDMLASFVYKKTPLINFSFGEVEKEQNIFSLINGDRSEGLVKWILRCGKNDRNPVICRGFGYSSITGQGYELEFVKKKESEFLEPNRSKK